MPMFHRIDVDIGYVRFKIIVIANGVHPKSFLPQLVFPACVFFDGHAFAQKVFGESCLDQTYALRVGKIIRR